MSVHPYHAKLKRVLARAGNLYTLNDILSLIARNEMQSWVEGESWFNPDRDLLHGPKWSRFSPLPRRLDEARVLHDRILIFAAEVGAGVIQAYGRKGWLHDAQRRGWKVIAENYVFQKDVM